ncbi:putative F-box domain, leucine-rich repeat domain superfamily, F-box-like domain superfamily [Helianthus annuus]|nr:putative F-box domain, leucine-rich repeat domain superfamily, F-box-like domain superfamily [Helianthus annuus]
MGQSPSSHAPPPAGVSNYRPVTPPPSSSAATSEIHSRKHSQEESDELSDSIIDYSSEIPDDCLALIFQFVTSGDRKRCSLVSKRWLLVEGQSRHRLTLNAQSELLPIIPSLFSRYDSVTKLSLRCDRRSVSLNDAGLIQISLRCRNLTRVKLRGCREITELGMAALGNTCKNLKKFSCGSCNFGAKGLNAFLDNCSSLEELSVKRLRGIDDGGAPEPIGPGASDGSLRSIVLKELYNGQLFGPLICGAKKLKTLKLIRCLGDWDRILETNRIGNEGLIAIAKHSVNLQELVLIGINPSSVSLEAIAMNCKKLERLALCGSETIADSEISCIASKCVALKKLCIKRCPVSDEGIEAFAFGCPNLVKIKVKKCRNVTGEVGDWLRSKRGSLVVNLDVCAAEVENVDAQEEPVEFSATMNQESLATSASGRGSIFRTRFGVLGGRGFVTSTFRRWSVGNSSSNGNL